MLYSYKAVDNSGKLVRGEMEAPSEMGLTTELAKKQLTPVSITFKTKARDSAGGRIKQGVDTNALVIFSRQFATIIKAAVPIIEGLRVLSEQTEDPALQKALKRVITDVEGGSSLSQALGRHPAVFSDLYVNTVVAGESAGILDKVLLRLARMLEDDMENKANIGAALRYPTMVVIAMFVAVIVLSVFVIPNFAKIYADAKLALPLPTQIMILMSNLILGPWKDSKNFLLILLWFGMVAGGAFGLFSLFMAFINTKPGRFWWDDLKFKVPVFGKLYTKVTMLRFSTMLSVLYQSGLPVLQTLDIVGKTIGNVVLNREIEIIKQTVADGKGISAAVLASKFFPKLVGYMISVGEKSGSLPLMLDSICEYFELEVKTTIKNLTTMIEPMMTAVLGLVVMGMALSIFLPLWNMISVLKGG